MNPEVAALLEELAADTTVASVTFFPMGLHTHLMSDGQGGWNLEVHTTRMSEEDVEEVVTAEEHLTTDDLVFRMGTLALVAEMYIDQLVEEAHVVDDVEAFLANLGE